MDRLEEIKARWISGREVTQKDWNWLIAEVERLRILRREDEVIRKAVEDTLNKMASA